MRSVVRPNGREKKLRFAIGSSESISEIWTLWGRKRDIYLSCESMRGRIKLSIHGSGVCQLAFDSNYKDDVLATPKIPFTDRTIKRWRRTPTPPVGPIHLTNIFFSSFETWDNSEEIACPKATELIPPPASGYAVVVSIFVSNDDPVDKCAPYEPQDIILGYFQIESGEYVTVLVAESQLPKGYFDFKNTPWFMGVGANSDSDWEDARGISSISFEPREDGGVDFHSRHNMRIVSVPVGTDLSTLNQEMP